jgi:hypothetical protein
MLKQQVLDLIAANLATGSNITAAEHRAVEEAIVDYVGLPTVAYGRIGPIDIADSTTSWSVTGNLSSATRVGSVSGKYVQIRVTIPSGLLTSTNFKVRSEVESASASPNLDNDMLGVLFRKDGSSTTTFDILLEEITAQTTSIYVHVEVIQL